MAVGNAYGWRCPGGGRGAGVVEVELSEVVLGLG